MSTKLFRKCVAALIAAGIILSIFVERGSSHLLSSSQSSKIRGGAAATWGLPQVGEFCVPQTDCLEDKCGWYGTSNCNGKTDTDKRRDVFDEKCEAGFGSDGWICFEQAGTSVCAELKGTCLWFQISQDPVAFTCVTQPASGFPTAPNLCGAFQFF